MRGLTFHLCQGWRRSGLVLVRGNKCLGRGRSAVLRNPFLGPVATAAAGGAVHRGTAPCPGPAGCRGHSPSQRGTGTKNRLWKRGREGPRAPQCPQCGCSGEPWQATARGWGGCARGSQPPRQPRGFPAGPAASGAWLKKTGPGGSLGVQGGLDGHLWEGGCPVALSGHGGLTGGSFAHGVVDVGVQGDSEGTHPRGRADTCWRERVSGW